jgi:hypothetical protein
MSSLSWVVARLMVVARLATMSTSSSELGGGLKARERVRLPDARRTAGSVFGTRRAAI